MARFLTLRELERRHILKVLRATGGNKTETSRILGVSDKTIFNKVALYKAAGRMK